MIDRATYPNGTINFELMMRRYAKEHSMTFRDAMKFFSTRDDLETGCGILGMAPSNGGWIQESVLNEFGKFLDKRGYPVPRLRMWSAEAYVHSTKAEAIEDKPKLEESLDLSYVALSDMDFEWTLRDVESVEHMWREGLSVLDMATAFDREPREVFYLLEDRLDKGTINPRRGGVHGNRRQQVDVS